VADSQVSTADANGDGTLNDLQISASVAMTNAVTINASGLTGANHIVVVGTNLGGAIPSPAAPAPTPSMAARASTRSMAGPETIRSRAEPGPTF